MVAKESSTRKSQARMTVYELRGKRVCLVSMKVERFRDDAHSVLNDAQYRKKKRIRWILGVVFDERGAMLEEFGRGYDARGRYIGQRVLKSSQIKLDTLANIKKTLKQRPRAHEGLAAPLRKQVVAVIAKELARARRLADIAKQLSIPIPTLTRWTAGVPRKRPPYKRH